MKLQAHRPIIGDAAPCACDSGHTRWNSEMRLDPLERGLRELSIKYSRAENGGHMQIRRPFEVSSVAGGRIGFALAGRTLGSTQGGFALRMLSVPPAAAADG